MIAMSMTALQDLAAGRRAALKEALLRHLEEERGRLAALEASSAELNEELEAFRHSVDAVVFQSDREINAAVERFQAIQLNVRRMEFEERHAQGRARAAFEKIGKLREKNIPSYGEALEKLEESIEASAGRVPSERLFELQKILDALVRLENTADFASKVDIEDMEEEKYVFASAISGNDRKIADSGILSEIRDWADRIAELDAVEGEKLLPVLQDLEKESGVFSERLRQLARQLKTTYGELRDRFFISGLFREELTKVLPVLRSVPDGRKLERRAELLGAGKYIDRALFMELYEEICRFLADRNKEIADALFAGKIGRVLNELGYELAAETPSAEASDFSPGRVHYLDSPYEGYRVMARMENGELTTRLVRLVGSEAEKNSVGAYQRQKDIETGEKWCRDFDRFLEEMKVLGFPMDVSMRKEPAEAEILVVVDASLAASTKRRSRAAEMKRSLEAERRE